VYGSNQVEIAWTVIPVLIVVALFMATARVIADVQKVFPSTNAIEVVAIGHQFWWEYRYPGLNVVTANELHVPVSDTDHPTPTFIKLLSADTDHSFWVPRLAGKTDLIPNHPNSMWIDPHETVFTWASVLNTAGHNTPRCFCVFMFSRMRTQPMDSGATQAVRSEDSASKGSEYSKLLPAPTATLWRAQRRKDALVPTSPT